MKKIILAVATALTLTAAFASESVTWLTDAVKATQQAKKENKLVLLNFTGSDWCGWCIKLKKEVFSQPEFATWAATNIVAVEVDFPRKTKLAPELASVNRALADKFKIEGYPTLIILNGDGKKVAEMGYVKGGPKAFIAEFEKLTKK
jgi:protein disulfide-isomerase